MELKDKTERLAEDQNPEQLNDELAAVTGGISYDDTALVPVDIFPFPSLKMPDHKPSAGKYTPPSADDCFSEPGESLW